MSRFPFREELRFSLKATVVEVFAYLDDFRRLSSHMERRSGMMMGAKMCIDVDAAEGRAVGSHIRMYGKILGISLALEEVVTDREPPHLKAWETVNARLVVIGQYRLGFHLLPAAEGTEIRIFIEYALPERGVSRLCGAILGRRYARWCIARMAHDAKASVAVASPT